MEKTIEIKTPDGYEIDREKSTFEQIVFKRVEKELPDKWSDLKKISGYKITLSGTLINRNCIDNDSGRNIFATKEQAEASVALAQLSQLREVYRQGWVPDWNDGEEKWCIFKERKIAMGRFGNLNHFLCFQSEEITKKFLDNFKDLIEKASPLLYY